MVGKGDSFQNVFTISSFLFWLLTKAGTSNPVNFVDLRPCENFQWDNLGKENELQIEDTKLRKYTENATHYGFRLANYTRALECDEGTEEATLYDSDSFRFTLFGHLGVEKCDTKAGVNLFEWYNPGEYCVNILPRRKQIIHDIKYCKDKEANKDVVTVIKCCTPGYTVTPVNGTKHKCLVEENWSWKPTIYDSSSVDGRCIDKKTGLKIRIQTRINQSPGQKWHFRETYRFNDMARQRVRWRLLDNGKLVELVPPAHGLYVAGKWVERKNLYCLDGLQKYHSDASRTTEIAVSLEEESAFEDKCGVQIPSPQSDGANANASEEYDDPCADYGSGNYSQNENTTTENEACEAINNDNDVEKRGGTAEHTAYIVSLFLAVIPLLLTMVAYWLTWSNQNLHGWTVFSHILSLMMMNICFGSALTLTDNYSTDEGNRNLKVIVGVLCHFFFLSTFMWLTMINFDLWWTFRKLKSSAKLKGFMRFVAYSVVSWGVPFMFILVGLILDANYGENGYDSDCDILIPNYGRSKFYLEPAAEGVYIYYPLLILLILNCGFFVTTVGRIYSPKCTRRGALNKKSGLDRHSVELFLKLFVVMGLTFTFDFISWAVHPNSNTATSISIFFVVVDIFNILGRAILIFIIFACKPQVMAKVRRLSLHKDSLPQVPPDSQQHPASSAPKTPAIRPESE